MLIIGIFLFITFYILNLIYNLKAKKDNSEYKFRLFLTSYRAMGIAQKLNILNYFFENELN